MCHFGDVQSPPSNQGLILDNRNIMENCLGYGQRNGGGGIRFKYRFVKIVVAYEGN